MSNMLKSLEGFIKYTAFNQKIIAGNVAHADEPGYKAQKAEMSFEKALNSYQNGGLTTTSSMHIKPNDSASGLRAIKDKFATNFKPNGNNVDKIEQSHMLSQNLTNYNAAINLLTKSQKFIKMAAKV